jgi:hypothetical protein
LEKQPNWGPDSSVFTDGTTTPFLNSGKIVPGCLHFGALPPLPVPTGFNQFHVPDLCLAKASWEFKNKEIPRSLTIGMEVKLYSTIFRDRKAAYIPFPIPFHSVADGPTFTYEEDLTFTHDNQDVYSR